MNSACHAFVGDTSYIRGPFIVETILYGIVAALLSVVICGALFSLSSTTFEASSLGLLDIGYANTFFTTVLLANHWYPACHRCVHRCGIFVLRNASLSEVPNLEVDRECATLTERPKGQNVRGRGVFESIIAACPSGSPSLDNSSRP